MFEMYLSTCKQRVVGKIKSMKTAKDLIDKIINNFRFKNKIQIIVRFV